MASSLPSTSTIRFVLLIVLVIVTSAAMGEYLSLLNTSIRDMAGQVLRCLYQRGIAQEDLLPQVDVLSNPAVLGCAGPLHTVQLLSMFAVVLAVVIGAYLLYAALPWWRRRRHRLTPLPADATALHEYLNALVREIGLSRAPTFMIAPYNRVPAGLAFGRRNRPIVQLNVGLLPTFLTDRTRFRTIVLHELAHVRNGDIGKTYFTLAVWRTFLLLALLPFALLNVFPNLVAGGERWSFTDLGNGLVRSMKLQSIAAVAALTILIYLTRAAVLRSREHLADLTAAEYGAPALDSILVDAKRESGRSRGSALLRSHPNPALRLRYLNQPGQRFRFDLAEVFAAGVAISAIGTSLTIVGDAAIKEPMFLGNVEFAAVLLSLATALSYSALIALYFSVIYWRVAFGEGGGPVTTPGVVSTAAAMTVGILLGEPLSLAGALGGLRLGIFGGLLFKGSFAGGVASALILFAAILLLARWTRDSATLQLTRPHRPSLRAALVTTTAIGGFALLCAVWIWYLFHGTTTVGRVDPWTEELARSRGEAYVALPGIGWINAQYAPLEFFAFVPFGTTALALPWVYTMLISQRRPAAAPAGQACARPSVTDSSPTPRFELAVWAGLAGAALYLVITSGCALLAGAWIRQIQVRYGFAAQRYLLYSCFHLVAVVSALVAAVVVARAPRLGITLGLAASFFIATISAALVPFGFALVRCETGGTVGTPGSMLMCVAGRAGRTAAVYPDLFAQMVPRAALAAVVAGLASAGVSSAARRIRVPHSTRVAVTDPEPTRSRGARVMFALCAVLPLGIALAVTAGSSIYFFGNY